MPGRVYNTLFELATEQYGYVTAEQAVELGFAKSRLPQMATRGVAERVERGLYRFPAMPTLRSTNTCRPSYGRIAPTA